MTDFSQRFLYMFIITDSGMANHEITIQGINTTAIDHHISSGRLLPVLYKQMIARYAAMNDTKCPTAGIQQLVQYVVTMRFM